MSATSANAYGSVAKDELDFIEKAQKIIEEQSPGRNT
jgi:hypothetical protein